ncbi:hypothetical protein [Saccharopolyspora phatthalungensis]|uniref:Uncharacterized protein n=1 Tax=Saccharopolyspora phatthalungensis TaxID=664693 RepID=A0A840QII9_9PSEU|nr:hypothetical protein [Saccharopolyspora phatthalungensis]MBB5158549.1 hypothetical protein [Saccharopolyspora phatthalungensis]
MTRRKETTVGMRLRAELRRLRMAGQSPITPKGAPSGYDPLLHTGPRTPPDSIY